MKFLLIGDVVGKGGRMALRALVPDLRRELGLAFVIANGENMAGGGGMTRKCLDELKDAGIDAYTGGDHMWDQRELVTEIASLRNVLRPANLPGSQPGVGHRIFPIPIGGEVLVVSLLGRTFMKHHVDCPFKTLDRILAETAGRTPQIMVDFHAEATSEKTAMARYFDGRVSAVLGTHTHVPTADETIFPGGTAFQCDVGMVGARESILGRHVAPVLEGFVTGMPVRFTVNDEGIRFHATLVETNAAGQAVRIERIVRDLA